MATPTYTLPSSPQSVIRAADITETTNATYMARPSADVTQTAGGGGGGGGSSGTTIVQTFFVM